MSKIFFKRQICSRNEFLFLFYFFTQIFYNPKSLTVVMTEQRQEKVDVQDIKIVLNFKLLACSRFKLKYLNIMIEN